MSLVNDLLTYFEPQMESVTLVPSSGGRYEISVNGQLIFSKLQTGRFPESGEIINLVQELKKKK